ncbi:MAG TPA: extracellular solute-binding protein [Polyangiaceae bacterium]|nr:extracellular solute-binding protein [Polyangiaceae bacterium]
MRHIPLVSLIALASTAACSADDTAKNDTDETVSEITVYTFGQPQMMPPHELAARTFKEKTGVKVNIVGEPAFQKLQPTLENKAKAGSADYDVFMTGNLWVADYVNLGYAEPLDSYIEADEESEELAFSDIPEGVRKKNEFGGKTYSLLVDNDNMFLFYRKDVFAQEKWRNAFSDELGHELPTPPQTIPELLEVAKFFADKDWNPDMTGETSFVTSNAGLGQSHYYLYSFVAPYTVMPADVAPLPGLLLFKPDMTPLVNTPGFVRGVTEWKEMMDCCVKQVNGEDDGPDGLLRREAVIEQMTRGQSLMAIDWGDIGPAAFRDEATIRDKVGFAMAPAALEYYDWQKEEWVTPDAPNYAPVHQFNGWAMYMASTSKKKQVAWDFIRHFVSPEISIQAVSDPAGGYQPWRTSHSTNHQFWEDRGWRSDDAEEYANAILDTTNHPNRVIDVRIPGSFTYGDYLEAQLKLVALGEKTPQEAMDDCAAELEELTTDLGREPQIEAYGAHLQ